MRLTTNRPLLRRLPTTTIQRRTQPFRPFTLTTRQHLKEDKAQSASEVENAKNEQLKPGQGKGQAREELKSASEAQVGADREKVKDHGEHMEKLQKETARRSEEEKKGKGQ